MTNQRRIQTDAQGARDIRELRQRLRSSDTRSKRRTRGPETSIVIQTLTDIDADNYQPQTVEQVKLIDGDWQRVRDVQVRSISGDQIRSGTRCRANRVGQLGWCIDRSIVDTVTPYLCGVLPAMRDAFDHAGEEFGRLELHGWEAAHSVAYDRVTEFDEQPPHAQQERPEKFLEPIFGARFDEPLDCLILGQPPSTISIVAGNRIEYLRHLTGQTPAPWIDEAFGRRPWVPAVESDENELVKAHLARGRDVVVFVEPLSHLLLETGDPANMSGNLPACDAAIQRLNEWLLSIDSQSQAYGLFDSKVYDMCPVLADDGLTRIRHARTGQWSAYSYEQDLLDFRAAEVPDGTPTISSDFVGGPNVPLTDRRAGYTDDGRGVPHESATYFQHPDESTYLQPVALRQCRFETQQPVPANSQERRERQRYCYRFTTGNSNDSGSGFGTYAKFGDATATAAFAIREPLPAGGTLYLLPAQHRSFNSATLTEHLWQNITAGKLPPNRRSAYPITSGYRFSIHGVPAFEEGQPLEQPRVTVFPHPNTNQNPFSTFHHTFGSRNYRRFQPGQGPGHESIHPTRSVYLTGLAVTAAQTQAQLGTGDEYVLEEWNESFSSSNPRIAFETPAQPVGAPDVPPPLFAVFIDDTILHSRQHVTTLSETFENSHIYRNTREVTGVDLQPWIEVKAIPEDTASRTAAPAFGEGTAQNPLAQQTITGIQQFFRRKPHGLTNSITTDRIVVWPYPGIFHRGKLYVPTQFEDPLPWNYSAEFAAYFTRLCRLGDFVDITDADSSLQITDEHPFFAIANVLRITGLDWDVNAASGGYYFFSSSSVNCTNDFTFAGPYESQE